MQASGVLTFINLSDRIVNRFTQSTQLVLEKYPAMSRIFISACFVLIASASTAQQKEGRITYQRSMELNIQISGNPQLANMLPKSRVNNFELNFNGNIASWKLVDDPQADETQAMGLVVRNVSAGDDFTYFDLENSRRVQQTEFAGKYYLVTDSIRRNPWKLTEETKTILGHPCRKAIATVVGKRMMSSMENGKMERKEVTDTSISEAWFTADIPVSAGPEIQGQLPGLILELSMRSGKVVYTALDISPKADQSALKEPGKGKKMNAAEFAKERGKILEQMQQNNGGPGGMRFSISQ